MMKLDVKKLVDEELVWKILEVELISFFLKLFFGTRQH